MAVVGLSAGLYVPGQRVTVRSGAMGGPFKDVINGAGLTYTAIDTAAGVIGLPNSGLLAAAIGPAPPGSDAHESSHHDL